MSRPAGHDLRRSWLHAAVDKLAGKLGEGRPLCLVLQVIDDAPAGGGPEAVRVLMVSPLEPGVRTGLLATDGEGNLAGGVVDVEPSCPRCTSPRPELHPATAAGGEVIAICPDPFHRKGTRP